MRQDLYEKAGLEGERIVFLLTDTQIIHEDFLEVHSNAIAKCLRTAACCFMPLS